MRRNYIAQLVNKTEMFSYVRKNSIPLAHRYAETPDLDTIDFLALPERIVVKPNNSADSDCVMLFSGGYEKFSGASVPQDIRAAFVAETFSKGRFLNSETKILAEEFFQDYDDRFEIPRDFKVFVAGGSAQYIQIIDRNGPRNSWSHSFYRRDWSRIDDQFNIAYIRGDDMPPPDRLDELLDLADRIAKDIDCFMRLDFFISGDRVIFGEFTSYPFAGLRYTEYGARALCALMDDHPDAF